MKTPAFQTPKMPRIAQVRGFTLLEVIVTAAIISIIASIGWQWYSKQILENRRKDAIAALVIASHAMTQCKSDNGIYFNCKLLPSNPPDQDHPYTYDNSGGVTALTSPNGFYTITAVMSANPDGYTLIATKIVADDLECLSLSLDNLDNKGYTYQAGAYPGPAPDFHHCWGG